MPIQSWKFLAIGLAMVGCARIEAAPSLESVSVASAPSSGVAILASTFSIPVASAASAPGVYDAVMAQRGKAQFTTSCSRCHVKPARGDAIRNAIRNAAPVVYKPLRDLWKHPPYFADHRAATLADVVEHYDDVLHLNLSETQKMDLVEYLRSR